MECVFESEMQQKILFKHEMQSGQCFEHAMQFCDHGMLLETIYASNARLEIICNN